MLLAPSIPWGESVLKHIKSSESWDQKSIGAKGFTLIELLVVIVILGILAAVVVFSVRGVTDNAKENACKTERRTLETAVEAYYAKYFGPTSEANLVTAGLIKAEATNYNVNATTGAVTTTGSECTGF
jgi:general secretion pathway protein G